MKKQATSAELERNKINKTKQTFAGKPKRQQTRLVKRLNLRTGEIEEEEERVRSRILY